MPSRRLRIALIAGLLLAGLAVLVVLQRPVPVPVVEVRAAPLLRTLVFTGRVATTSRVEVGSTLTGRVQAVQVREGDGVAAGQPLVQLETEELRAALAQALASQRQAEARLAGLRSTGRSASDAAVAQAEAVLRAAQADLRRQQDLVQRGFVSEARLDEARRALAVAEAQREAARAQAAAQADAGSEVLQAQAQLAAAQGAVGAARARLAQSVIAAPTAARVLARLVEPGQIVQPGRALVALALSGPVQLVAQVDERYLEQLRVGQSARVQADAFPSRGFFAQVLSLSPLVDAQRGAVEVKLALSGEAPAFLREDMTLSVEVETGRRDQALVLPVQALQGPASGERASVRVVQDGRVQERPVRLGLRTLDAVEVTDGLRAGEAVVLGPSPPVGDRARPLPAAAAAGQATAGARSRDSAGGAMTQAVGR